MDLTVSHNNINFKSGLTREIIELEKKTNPKEITRYFKNSPYTYNDWETKLSNIDFKNNKAYALACRMCAEIFKAFRKAHNYDRQGRYSGKIIFPNDIFVYDKSELTTKFIEQYPEYFFFVNGTGDRNIINGKYFPRQTIFFDNKIHSLEEINSIMETNGNSTKHFLQLFIHEWLHALQGKCIYADANRGWSIANYENTINFLQKRHLSPKENEIVADILGKYASSLQGKPGQFSEIFAEAWAKFICDSLDKDCVHFKKDPVDEIKKTPKEFQKILKKVSNITFISHRGNTI